MKVSENFNLQEFVPPEIYNRFGNSAIWFIDRKIINIAQFIRGRFKAPVTINNWSSGGSFKYRGFDPPGGYRKSTSLSQHRMGRGLDLNVKGSTPDEIREDIVKNFSTYNKLGLTTIEDGKIAKTWVHLDVREIPNATEVLIVKP